MSTRDETTGLSSATGRGACQSISISARAPSPRGRIPHPFRVAAQQPPVEGERPAVRVAGRRGGDGHPAGMGLAPPDPGDRRGRVEELLRQAGAEEVDALEGRVLRDHLEPHQRRDRVGGDRVGEADHAGEPDLVEREGRGVGEAAEIVLAREHAALAAAEDELHGRGDEPLLDQPGLGVGAEARRGSSPPPRGTAGRSRTSLRRRSCRGCWPAGGRPARGSRPCGSGRRRSGWRHRPRRAARGRRRRGGSARRAAASASRAPRSAPSRSCRRSAGRTGSGR